MTSSPQGARDADARDDAAANLLTCESLASWFFELVGDALENQGVDATDKSEFYVVSVLESYADADEFFGLDPEGQRRDDALAMILHDAVFGQSHDSVNKYRRLGDVALFVSGFFADSLRRQSVGVTYYIDMGQGAYGTLSSMFKKKRHGAALSEIFEELADTFPDWVEVLREVSERANLSPTPSEQDTAELVERLGRVRGQRHYELSEALIRRGLLPAFG